MSAWSQTSPQSVRIVAQTCSMIVSASVAPSRKSGATSRQSHSWLALGPSRLMPMAWLETEVERGDGARS